MKGSLEKWLLDVPDRIPDGERLMNSLVPTVEPKRRYGPVSSKSNVPIVVAGFTKSRFLHVSTGASRHGNAWGKSVGKE